MYSHPLRVVVFSADPMVGREISNLPGLSNFEAEVIIRDEFNTRDLAMADVAIIGLPVPLSYAEARLAAGKDCVLVWCMSEDCEASLTDEDIACLDDTWLLPLRPPRIRLRTKNILEGLRRDYDARTHLIWLDTLIDSMPDLVWFKDLDGVHHKVNTSFCKFVHKTPEQIVGRKHCEIWDIPPEECEKGEFACRESENAAIATGTTYVTDEIVLSGSKKHLFKTFKTAVRNPDGEVVGTLGYAHDLTNLLNLNMELDIFMEAMPFPLIICDNGNKVVQVNSHFLAFFGLSRQDVLGRDFKLWKDGFFNMTASPITGEQSIRHDAGKRGQRYITITEKEMRDIFGHTIGGIKIFRDVTADKELELHVWRTANTDALTGLANRHALSEYIKTINSKSDLHLFYIDLDNFKAVNDTWGHKAGDEALKIVAKSLRNIFTQDFPARLGGDEFLVCSQRDVPLSELERLSTALLRRLAQKFTSSDKLSSMSASIGIRAFGHPSDPIETLIRQADLAMYEAKKSGKAQYCFWDENLGSGE